MQLKHVFTSLAGAALIVTPAAAADTYEIDAAHSDVNFTVRHMMVSKVRGAFNDVSGTIVFDSENPTASSVEVTVPVTSIDTGNDKRDEHLRSPDFFDVEKYPNLSFKSSSVTASGEGYIVKGTLTMHGVSKQIELPFTLNGPVADPWGNTRIGVEAKPIVLDRKEFGLEWNTVMEGGGLVVGDDITVEIAVALVKQSEPAAE